MENGNWQSLRLARLDVQGACWLAKKAGSLPLGLIEERIFSDDANCLLLR